MSGVVRTAAGVTPVTTRSSWTSAMSAAHTTDDGGAKIFAPIAAGGAPVTAPSSAFDPV